MTKPTSRAADADLHARVRAALLGDPGVDPFTVSLVVRNGVVRILGQVGSYAERLGVGEIVEAVAGVVGLTNELTVQPYGDQWAITSEQIGDDIATALAHAGVAATGIEVLVDYHVVELHGRVGSAHDRAIIRHAVQSVAGVHFIDNRILVDEVAQPSLV